MFPTQGESDRSKMVVITNSSFLIFLIIVDDVPIGWASSLGMAQDLWVTEH